MPIQKQLSVFMPNRPGVLARTCSALSEAGVNIMAMAVHDSVDGAVVRFLVDHPTKALLLLEGEELFVMEQEVVVVELENGPGRLARVAQILAQADINIHYAYCTATNGQKTGCLVLKTDQPDRALDILNHSL
ncbi:MAG: ACT domain-containing protein [Candidatus Omnitrophica bacterium]|nr:ACT domain-containing protein [Candidatus Omnitrophota bacterium]